MVHAQDQPSEVGYISCCQMKIDRRQRRVEQQALKMIAYIMRCLHSKEVSGGDPDIEINSIRKLEVAVMKFGLAVIRKSFSSAVCTTCPQISICKLELDIDRKREMTADCASAVGLWYL